MRDRATANSMPVAPAGQLVTTAGVGAPASARSGRGTCDSGAVGDRWTMVTLPSTISPPRSWPGPNGSPVTAPMVVAVTALGGTDYDPVKYIVATSPDGERVVRGEEAFSHEYFGIWQKLDEVELIAHTFLVFEFDESYGPARYLGLSVETRRESGEARPYRRPLRTKLPRHPLSAAPG